jgi:hypothetical protein
MEMIVVKSLHSGDPDMIQNTTTCKYLIIRGKEQASAIRVKANYLLAYIRACAPGISPCVTAKCTLTAIKRFQIAIK